LMASLTAGTDIKIEVVRKDGKKTDTLTVKLDTLPDTVPDKLPEPATLKKEDKDKKNDDKKEAAKAETGLLKRTNAAKDHEYWIYVPSDYDPNISYALV